MAVLRLAWRYATRRWVNLAAVLAVAAALAVQIVSMAVLDGMVEGMRRRLLGLGEQITLTASEVLPAPDGAEGRARRRVFMTRDQWDAAADALRAVPGVRAVLPHAVRAAQFDHDGWSEYGLAQGIDLAREARSSELANHLLQLKLDPENPSWHTPDTERTGLPAAFMGAVLAEKMHVKPGDVVAVLSAYEDERGVMQTLRKQFVVTSLLRTGWPDKDEYAVYMPLEAMMDFFWRPVLGEGAGELVPGLSVYLDDPEQADALAETAERATAGALRRAYPGAEAHARTWTERWETMVEGMRHENRLMELVLALYNIAGGLCVFAILSTLVSRRVRDIGLLRCVGAGRGQVLAAFVLVGLTLGFVGAALGVSFGLFASGPLAARPSHEGLRLEGGGMLTAEDGYGGDADRPRLDRWFEAVTGERLYPPRMFGVQGGLPMVVYPWKLAVYACGAVLIAMLAALYPAAWAATREPAAALRDE